MIRQGRSGLSSVDDFLMAQILGRNFRPNLAYFFASADLKICFMQKESFDMQIICSTWSCLLLHCLIILDFPPYDAVSRIMLR